MKGMCESIKVKRLTLWSELIITKRNFQTLSYVAERN